MAIYVTKYFEILNNLLYLYKTLSLILFQSLSRFSQFTKFYTLYNNYTWNYIH